MNRPGTGVTVAFGEQRLERIGEGYFQIGFDWRSNFLSAFKETDEWKSKNAKADFH